MQLDLTFQGIENGHKGYSPEDAGTVSLFIATLKWLSPVTPQWVSCDVSSQEMC